MLVEPQHYPQGSIFDFNHGSGVGGSSIGGDSTAQKAVLFGKTTGEDSVTSFHGPFILLAVSIFPFQNSVGYPS